MLACVFQTNYKKDQACHGGGCRPPFCQVLILQSPIRRCHSHTGLTDCCGEPWEGWGCLQPIRRCMGGGRGGRLRLAVLWEMCQMTWRYSVGNKITYVFKQGHIMTIFIYMAKTTTDQLTFYFQQLLTSNFLFCFMHIKFHNYASCVLWRCVQIFPWYYHAYWMHLSYICTNHKCLLEASFIQIWQKHLFSAVRCQFACSVLANGHFANNNPIYDHIKVSNSAPTFFNNWVSDKYHVPIFFFFFQYFPS